MNHSSCAVLLCGAETLLSQHEASIGIVFFFCTENDFCYLLRSFRSGREKCDFDLCPTARTTERAWDDRACQGRGPNEPESCAATSGRKKTHARMYTIGSGCGGDKREEASMSEPVSYAPPGERHMRSKQTNDRASIVASSAESAGQSMRFNVVAPGRTKSKQ